MDFTLGTPVAKLSAAHLSHGSIPIRGRVGRGFNDRVGLTRLSIPRISTSENRESTTFGQTVFTAIELTDDSAREYTVRVQNGELRFEDRQRRHIGLKLENQDGSIYFRVFNLDDIDTPVDFRAEIKSFSYRYIP